MFFKVKSKKYKLNGHLYAIIHILLAFINLQNHC